MCTPYAGFYCGPLTHGLRRVERKRIRLTRLHKYASDRFLFAQTPWAAMFWSNIMRACIVKYETFESR